MSHFGDDYFGEEENNNYEYGDEFSEDEFSEHGPIMSAGIPIEVINSWKRDETNLEVKRINLSILKQVIKSLEKSWFWRFCPLSKRIKMIHDSYYSMVDLVLD
jgi:hypothetical protein